MSALNCSCATADGWCFPMPARASAAILKEAFEKMFEATRLMKSGQQKGRVTVSAAPSFAAKWLMPRLYEFSAANEDIDVWVSADMAPVDFAVSDIDLAVRYGSGHWSGLHVEHLLAESVVPVCSPALFDAAPIRKPADLAHQPAAARCRRRVGPELSRLGRCG